MKKLTILMVVILVAGLLAGCWLFPESKLISIVVEPEGVYLDEPATAITGHTEAIESVTANYSDETSEDIKLTDCEYLSNDPEVAIVEIVEDEVWIRAVGTGDTTILVTYTQHNFWTGRVIETDIVGVFVN
ncbi:hypothetical protein ES704_01010 [subsurface metagenome]|jgi:uncharacterized protein (UPF0179 family)